jgi:integrase
MRAKRRTFPEVVKVGSCTVTINQEVKPSGTYFRLSYYMGGKRMRPTFSEYDQAKAEAEAKAAQLARGDMDALQITGKDRHTYGRALDAVKTFETPLDAVAMEYAEARKILGGHSLVDAARFFMRHHGHGIAAKLLPEAVDEMIAEKKRSGLSQLYLNDLKYRLGVLKERFQCPVKDLTPEDVRQFFNALELSPRSFNNFVTTVSTFAAFSQDHGWLSKDADLLAKVEKRKQKSVPVEIFTSSELAKILKQAREELKPCIAIQAFSGLRTEELLRLTWEDTRRRPGFIEIEAGKAKAARRRLVPICDALAHWLSPYAQESGPVWPHSKPYLFRCTEQAVEKATAIEEKEGRESLSWKANGLRHSYISYRLAETQKADQVALEAGNSPQMIFAHYRELVTPEQAKAWFAIKPTKATNILPMKARTA